MGLLKRTVDLLANHDISLKACSQVVETKGIPVNPRLFLLKDKQSDGNDKPEFRVRITRPGLRWSSGLYRGEWLSKWIWTVYLFAGLQDGLCLFACVQAYLCVCSSVSDSGCS